ncbi:MAG: hypothetical protein Q8P84_03840 [Deltaproteobacteria bacterium]|nr:hypothetical protein [Deltaproteobacteria bacterium]MDZ4224743.1 hypothetical protein [bacterium]
MKTRFKDFEPIVPGVNPSPMKIADFTLPQTKKPEAVKEPPRKEPVDEFVMDDNNPLKNFKSLIG